jgi:DNA-binding transcriptional MocR family regulator
VSAADVARSALCDNLVLAPGDVFSVSQSASDFMRFNVAQMTDPRIFTLLAKALAAPNYDKERSTVRTNSVNANLSDFNSQG